MAKKKVNEETKQPKPKKSVWEDPCIIWDGPLIAETVILTILAVAFIGGGLFLYFYDLDLGLEDNSWTVMIKSLSAPLIISGLSYLLFFSYRVMELDGSKWFHALLNLVYLGAVGGLVYYNWYYCEALFAEWDATFWQYIFWANSVACGVVFLLFYSIAVHVREWSKPWDIVLTVLMSILFPLIVAIAIVVLCVGGVIAVIHIPGALIQKSVDNDLAARASSGRKEYTVRHESGYEETAYSDNGSDFYGTDGSYIGHKD